ncbi:uncharacterized protein B0H18DRAFT_999404 [Fomitopsis serialis]|uniref:uncharacterized protein n=1 Tax=Fomitopsis serialis TaxID=139415 RepID=UPI002008B609|nr:uncharacterized protein B0H18DRAFT_999404 [Neoantrodia serialis]KAH9928923.1 hypothetical protein B0H18DRAFT_999404 [Neoantrodia serialis]
MLPPPNCHGRRINLRSTWGEEGDQRRMDVAAAQPKLCRPSACAEQTLFFGRTMSV